MSTNQVSASCVRAHFWASMRLSNTARRTSVLLATLEGAVVGGANGGPGSTITIASGVATMYPGAPMIFLAGEGAAADVLDTLTPIARLGERVYIVANHEITFNHAAGGTGQVLCPGGVDYVLAQYGAVCLVSSDPNWILVEG